MNFLAKLKNRKTSMRRKLFLYMLALAMIVLAFLACGLFFFGHFSSAKQRAANTLSFQMRTFDRQISKYFEDVTRMGESLSESVAQKTDDFLAGEGISFSQLTNDGARITALQNLLFDKLGAELLKTDCSGVFLTLNATTNTHAYGADKSKTAIYLKRSSLNETDEKLRLYRGVPDIASDRGILTHRKWRLEMQVEEIPDYGRFLKRISPILNKSPFITSVSVLRGTSERTMHLVLPVVNKSNVVYGLCGFEISADYFKKYFAQPSQLEHLTCMFFPKNGDYFHTDDGFSAGVYGGYYLPPQGKLTVKSIRDGLSFLNGDSSYIAKIQPVSLCGDDYVLIAAYPKEEYNRSVVNNTVSVVLLVLLLVGTTVAICVFFSRRFLSPLLKSIEQIQTKQHKTAESAFVEIDDLFGFLAEQDRLRDEEEAKLRDRCDEQGDLLKQNRTDIDRLAYSRKTEVSPDDYEMFKKGIKTLTKTERQIFGLYLEGKTAEEIMQTFNIQKSTLKYHNHNILGKLGVSSRKQMLRYATLLKQETEQK